MKLFLKTYFKEAWDFFLGFVISVGQILFWLTVASFLVFGFRKEVKIDPDNLPKPSTEPIKTWYNK